MEKKKIKEFYDKVNEIADIEEYCNADISAEVGAEMDNFRLTTSDLQEIVDTYPNDWNIRNFVKPQLDWELKEMNKTLTDVFEYLGNESKNKIREIVKKMSDEELVTSLRQY